MPTPSKGVQVRLSAEQKEEIRLLYWNGTPYEEIVKRYGCSKSNFWLIVRNMRRDVLNHRFDIQLEALIKLPEAKLGWVAGIVDGEGYIGIVQAKDKRRGTFTLMPRVDIVSTTKVMQDELQRVLGFGCVFEKKAHQRRKPNEKVQFAWEIWSAATVGPFLSVIEPYLIVKREVASVVRAFCESRIERDLQPYSDADMASLKKVHQLNRRGVVDRKVRAA